MNNSEKRKVLTELAERLAYMERNMGACVNAQLYAEEGSIDYRVATDMIKQGTDQKFALWRDFDKTLKEFLP